VVDGSPVDWGRVAVQHEFPLVGAFVNEKGSLVEIERPGGCVERPSSEHGVVPWRACAVGEVLDDVIDPAGRVVEVVVVIDGSHDFLSDNRP
jgi:hypothetical protein